jgi:phage repressor protein C with HTH and peptisase S24 domain
MQDSSFSSFFERLQSASPIKNQSQLAEALQVGRSAVSLSKQKDSVPTRWIFFLAKKYQLNATWLATGEGYPYQAVEGQQESYVIVNRVLPRLGPDGELEPAGEDDHLVFVAHRIEHRGDPRFMACMEMTGTCMEPEIRAGDSVVIDRSSTDIYAGRIYALGVEDLVLVRRVEKLPDTLVLHCDNPLYSPVYLRGEDRKGVCVLGRVIWSERWL